MCIRDRGCSALVGGQLVLIGKRKDDPELPMSCQPLFMLDTVEKLLEKLISTRLGMAITSVRDLYEK